jgi:hypothetical protein
VAGGTKATASVMNVLRRRHVVALPFIGSRVGALGLPFMIPPRSPGPALPVPANRDPGPHFIRRQEPGSS